MDIGTFFVPPFQVLSIVCHRDICSGPKVTCADSNTWVQLHKAPLFPKGAFLVPRGDCLVPRGDCFVPRGDPLVPKGDILLAPGEQGNPFYEGTGSMLGCARRNMRASSTVQ